MRDRIVEYVREKIDGQFDPDRDQLIQYLDSVSLLQLLLFIEQEFHIALDMSQLDLEVFTTLNGLVEMLEAQSTAGKA